MKSYLDLIPRYANVHKRENRMTLLCIVFAVFLVCVIFSMAEMTTIGELARLSNKHGSITLADVLNSSMGQTFLITAILLFILVLVAGVLMISGLMNSTIAQRTRFFGMMRCLGMSKKQIKRYVRLEALNWCKSAIPLGLLLGILSTWLLCWGLKTLFGEEFVTIPVGGLSWIGIIAGALVGIITVLISSSSPAKKASNVSAISAVSGNANPYTSSSRIRLKPFRIETQLGIHHATGSKKNLFLMTGSFILSIALLFSFSSLIDFVDYLMPQSTATEDFSIYSGDGANTIPPATIEALRQFEGVENVFARRSLLDLSGLWIHGTQSTPQTIDLISFDDFDLDALSKDGKLRKGSDLEQVKNGNPGVLATASADRPWKVGDQVEIFGQKVTITGLLKYDPFSQDGLTHDTLTLISGNPTFTKLTGIQDYSMVLLRTSPDLSETSIQQIEQLTPANCTLSDQRDIKTSGTYRAFVFCVYVFLLVILLVSALNIINCLSMSVSSRIHQYETMRAIGMDDTQLSKMVLAKSMTYALLGCLIGCLIGIVLNKILFDVLIASHYAYAEWSLPFWEIVFVIVFLLLNVCIATYGPLKRIYEMSITDTINEL